MKKRANIIVLFFILLFVAGCDLKEPIKDQLPTKDSEKLAAEKFARILERNDWSSAYDMLIPEIKEKASKDYFMENIALADDFKNIVIRIDSVSMESPTEAYFYSTIFQGSNEIKIPATEMIYVNGSWHINALYDYAQYDMKTIKYAQTKINELGTIIDETLESVPSAIYRAKIEYQVYDFLYSTGSMYRCGQLTTEKNRAEHKVNEILLLENAPPRVTNAAICLKEKVLPVYFSILDIQLDICKHSQVSLGSNEVSKVLKMEPLYDNLKKEFNLCVV